MWARVAAPQTGLHEQHDQVADGGVAEPSQVGVGLELVHHELGDEERQVVGRPADLFFMDDGVGGESGQSAMSVAPVEQHLHEGQRVVAGVRGPGDAVVDIQERKSSRRSRAMPSKPVTSGCSARNNENRAKDWAPLSIVLNE